MSAASCFLSAGGSKQEKNQPHGCDGEASQEMLTDPSIAQPSPFGSLNHGASCQTLCSLLGMASAFCKEPALGIESDETRCNPQSTTRRSRILRSPCAHACKGHVYRSEDIERQKGFKGRVNRGTPCLLTFASWPPPFAVLLPTSTPG